MRREPEHDIQCAFIEWTLWAEKGMPELQLGFACPNGGGRNKAQAGKLKAEGVRPGVPDWILPVARCGYIGLAIEFKSPTGSVSEAQRNFIDLMRAGGWMVQILRSPDAAIDLVTAYLATDRAKLTPAQQRAIVRGVHVT